MTNFQDFTALMGRYDEIFALLAMWGAIAGVGLAAGSALFKLPSPRKLTHWIYSPRLALALGAFARLPNLRRPLWYDETFTAGIANTTLGNFSAAVLGDVHPPLFYGLEWLLVKLLGDNGLILRMPAYIAGVALIWLSYQLARAFGFSSRTAGVAALLVAVLPAPVHYSNEARAYTLLAAAVFAAMIAILRNKPRWFMLAAGALAWLHNIGFVYLALLAALAVVYHNWRGRWLRAAIVAAGVGGVWLPAAMQQSSDLLDGFWLAHMNIGSVFRPLAEMTAIMDLPVPLVVPVTWLLFAITVISLIEIAPWALTRSNTKNAGVWLVVALGVPVALAVVSYMWTPVYLPRALLPAALLYVILWAHTMTERPASMIVTPAVAVLVIVSAAGYFTSPQEYKVDLGVLLDDCDSVYYTSTAIAIAGRYYNDSDFYVWAGANDLNQTLQPAAKQAIGFVEGTPERGRWCIIQSLTPASSERERQHVDSILNRHHVLSETFMRVNSYYWLYLYVVDFDAITLTSHD